MRSKHSALGARALVVAAAVAGGGALAGCSDVDPAATADAQATSSRSATQPRTTIAGAAIRDSSRHAAANDARSN